MARQQGGSPRTESNEQQQQQYHAGPSQGAGGATGATTGAQGAAQSDAPSDAARGDQERQLDVTREDRGATSGRSGATRQQDRGGRTGSAGTSVSGRGGGGMQRQQGSLLPALMADPALMASAMISNPFAFAQAMSREMDRLFSSTGEVGSSYDQFASGGGSALTSGRQGRGLERGAQGSGRALAQWMPPMEVFQRGNDLVVRADLPGLRPDDVNIEIDDGMLIISGERQQSNEDREQGLYHSERSYGAFARSIPLPDGIDEDKVQARFEHGVLEVTAPLPEQRSRARRVQIQAPGAGQSTSQSAAKSAGQRQSVGQQPAPSSVGGEKHQGAAGREGGSEQTHR